MAKFRSRTNYADVYASDKGGYNLGIDGSVYVREEAVPRVFQVPRVGTQAKSTSGSSPSTDISGGTDTTLKVKVGSGAIVTVVLTVAGLSTGSAIAAELETKINAALLANGQDARVWVEFSGGLYVVWNQFTGDDTDVVITDGVSNNVADDLKLGVSNGGTEIDGTDDQDFLLYTTGGPTFSQPIESNEHRSGRFHSGIIKKKKMAEFDFDTYVNMSGSAGASLDTAMLLLLEAHTGKRTDLAGVAIDFEQGLPSKYFSIVRVSTIFGEYYTGGYTKGLTISWPGAGPATKKFTGKASKAAIAGIAKVNGVVSASTDVILEAGESEGYTELGRVMAVAADGRTITHGADGSLYVVSYDDSLEKIVLNSAVSLADNTYIVPWDPGAVQQTARDNIYTDLVGSFKFNSGGSAVDITEATLDIQNDHVDHDNYFGRDANAGFAAANRATANLSVTVNLSNENYRSLVRTREFGGFTPQLVLGDEASGRYQKLTATKWIPAVPSIEVPQNGVTPVTFEGILYESSPGAKDPYKLRYG